MLANRQIDTVLALIRSGMANGEYGGSDKGCVDRSDKADGRYKNARTRGFLDFVQNDSV